MPRKAAAPTYLRHGDYARTKIDGKYVSLGRWNSDESLRRFHELRARWRTSQAGVAVPASSIIVTVAELAAAWFAHVGREGLYLRADGSPTRETESWKQSVGPLLRLFGSEPARDFSPRKLKTVRRAMLDGSWLTDEERASRIAGAWDVTCSRKTTNQRIGRIVRLFEFGVSEELLPVEVFQALKTVTSLPTTHETRVTEAAIDEVPDQDIRDTLPLLAPIPRALAMLQLATGMRPGEVCSIERAHIDTTGLVVGQRRLWVYRPGGGDQHKTAHHGVKRQVALGPAAQFVLRPFLAGEGRWLFTSRTRAGETVAYHVGTYAQQILEAARTAGVPDWQPFRLRKCAATDIHAKMDLDHARAALGHLDPETTRKFYARADLIKAAESAAKLG